MDPTPDDLAGVVDLFGGLTRAELHDAFVDLSARSGADPDQRALDGRIDAALAEYYLLAVEHDDGRLLVPGPVALPTLPEHAEDLPHMLDVEERSVDHEQVARTAEERLRADAAVAVRDDDGDRIEALLDVCYEVDAWGVDTAGIRDRLASAVE